MENGSLPPLVVCQNVKRFRRGLVLKAHRLSYHSTLGSRMTKNKKKVVCQSVLQPQTLHPGRPKLYAHPAAENPEALDPDPHTLYPSRNASAVHTQGLLKGFGVSKWGGPRRMSVP